MRLTFGEFCMAVWRAWFVVLAIVVLALVAATTTLLVQPSEYQSTATVQVSSSDIGAVLGHVDAMTAVYAEAIESPQTAAAAQQSMRGPLAQINARTFTGSPVIKVDAQSTDPQLAQQSAAAVVDTVNSQSADGQYGFAGTSLVTIQPPVVPSSPVSPRPTLTYAVAAVGGVGLGIVAALIMEALRRRQERAAAEAATLAQQREPGLLPYGTSNVHDASSLENELDAALRPLETALYRVRSQNKRGSAEQRDPAERLNDSAARRTPPRTG